MIICARRRGVCGGSYNVPWCRALAFYSSLPFFFFFVFHFFYCTSAYLSGASTIFRALSSPRAHLSEYPLFLATLGVVKPLCVRRETHACTVERTYRALIIKFSQQPLTSRSSSSRLRRARGSVCHEIFFNDRCTVLRCTNNNDEDALGSRDQRYFYSRRG